MTYLVAAIVALASFALVAYPFFQRREELELALQPLDIEVEDLHSRREAVYSAIKELDFEYQLGNLSQADYQDLRGQYRQKAALVLREIDELAEAPPPPPAVPVSWDDEIEEAVRSLRAGHGKRAGRPRAAKSDHMQPQGIEPPDHESPGPPLTRARFCPQCGVAAGPADRFCAGCGSPLSQSCQECGAGLGPGDAFCPVCGARVAKGRRR